MKESRFYAVCPYELGDTVKIVLDKEQKVLSESVYVVGDILALHSVRSGAVSFKLVLVDEQGRDLAPREMDTVQMYHDPNKFRVVEGLGWDIVKGDEVFLHVTSEQYALFLVGLLEKGMTIEELQSRKFPDAEFFAYCRQNRIAY